MSGSSILCAFILISNPLKVNKKGNLLLGMFIISIFFSDIETLANVNNTTITSSVAVAFLFFSWAMMGPLFYLSVQGFVHPDKIIVKNVIIHALFPGAMTIVFYFIYETKAFTVYNDALVTYFQIPLVSFYCFLAYRALDRHNKKLLLYSSNTQKTNLSWLSKIIFLVTAMSAVFIIDIITHIDNDDFMYIYSAIYYAGIIIITYYTIRQQEIYPDNREERKIIFELIEENAPEPKKTETIPGEEIMEITKELQHVMMSRRPYLDEDINLLKLSELVNVKPHQLSMVINTGLGKNFNQFINEYRVEEAKKLLTCQGFGHFNIHGIAFEAGFNSKTTFNTTFKKLTGYTPTEYRRQVLGNPEEGNS
ncbi:helix-turn-helix domain-containing protein [Flavobacterium cyanobacteriorum]|nr:AraC family transcriptional regulator [Flavobacterium cyanobacteriorum]